MSERQKKRIAKRGPMELDIKGIDGLIPRDSLGNTLDIVEPGWMFWNEIKTKDFHKMCREGDIVKMEIWDYAGYAW